MFTSLLQRLSWAATRNPEGRLGRSHVPRRQAKPRPRCLPQLEALEDRIVPSEFKTMDLYDLGVQGGTYQGQSGGLYPDGTNAKPQAAITVGQGIHPISTRVVMTGIGMSNSQYTFSALLNIIKNRPGGPGNLFFVNGAQGGMDAHHWANPSDPCWGVLAQDRFALEAQILLIELAERTPQQYGGFPAHAQQLASDVRATIANAVQLMPNLKLVYLESVNHTFTTSLTSVQPEPYAFEGAYGMRLAIGANTQPFPVVWGPYLWADSDPRLYDGFNFPQSDVLSDNVHPSPAGAQALGKMMDNWFKADPSCSPWYSGRAKNPQGGIVVNPAATSQFAITGLPANYTFTTTDSGVHTFARGATLKTAGNQTIIATDTVTSTVTGKRTVIVNPAAAALRNATPAGTPAVSAASTSGANRGDRSGDISTGQTTAVVTAPCPLRGSDSAGGRVYVSAAAAAAGKHRAVTVDAVFARSDDLFGPITPI